MKGTAPLYSVLISGRTDLFKLSLERALELMDLTTDHWNEEKPFSWLREFLRLREEIAGLYLKGEAGLPREITNIIRAFLDSEPSCHNLGLII